MFGLRARVVTGAMEAAASGAYLSGLLLGAEWHEAAADGLADEARRATVRRLRLREDAFPKLISELEEEVFEKTTLEHEYDRLLKKELRIKEQLDGQNRSLAAAARLALDQPSQSVRPGSFTCTCVSTRPGRIHWFPTSITCPVSSSRTSPA